MTNTPSQKKRRITTPVMIAIITLIGICVTTLGAIIVGTFPSILENLFNPKINRVEEIIFRVTEINGKSIPQAKVILLSGNDIHIQYTDSNGASSFNLIKAENLRVFVETEQYEIYDQIFSADTLNPIEIRLNPKDVSRKSVIVRVIDDKDDIPINGAEVILILNGNIYSQTTDSNGITKFTTEFPSDEIDGDISVSVSGFKAEHQRVTLLADHVQDIRLDKNSGTLTVGFTGQGKEVARTLEASVDTVFGCSSQSLSVEEVANCGSHEYQYTRDMVIQKCTYENESYHEEGTQSFLIVFSEDGRQMQGVNGDGVYTKIDTNIYQIESEYDSKKVQDTVMFNENGFEWDSKAFRIENGNLWCESLSIYVLK